MKIFSIKDLEYVASRHEDPQNPGVVKKVILTKDQFEISGTIQMINWAKMGAGRSFAPHAHESMDEIFIILTGKAEIKVGGEIAVLEATDTVYLPQKIQHEMKNISDGDVEYLAIGIVGDKAREIAMPKKRR
jgi:mannose-6-phosphate isomerase-like protein (cupin superfamily)